ncbi:MAG: helix-hairpin-helix domain-containing protein [Bacteroidales bacterium]|nr:helix-hairpin-helix domain-containing protein [Bacteroidales bacterium]
MSLIWDQVRNWFGFTRRERRATFILLVLIILIISARYIIPVRPVAVEIVPAEIRMVPSGTATAPDSHTEPVPAARSRAAVQRITPVDLNRCDSASLEALPGIGPVLSARIIRYRNLLGGYARVSQLREVYGLSEETFLLIEKRLFADSLAVRRIDINKAQYRDLIRLPYLEKSEVNGILKFRELEGRIASMTDLIINKLISPEKVTSLSPYLEFGE